MKIILWECYRLCLDFCMKIYFKVEYLTMRIIFLYQVQMKIDHYRDLFHFIDRFILIIKQLTRHNEAQYFVLSQYPYFRTLIFNKLQVYCALFIKLGEVTNISIKLPSKFYSFINYSFLNLPNKLQITQLKELNQNQYQSFSNSFNSN